MPNLPRANLVLGGLLMVVATMTAQGCGSSSSSNATDVCTRACVKTEQCFAGPDAGVDPTASCKADCMTQSGTTGTTCTNQNQIASAANACLAMSDCTAFITCALGIPKCQGSAGGQGGSTGGGTGGTTGGNGDAGAGASCSSCDKAGTCCAAIATLSGQSSAACAAYSTASCNAVAAGSQGQYAQTCAAVLTSGASLSAACR